MNQGTCQCAAVSRKLLNMPYMITKACTRCEACLKECPTGSISEGKSQFFIDADTCAEHAACFAVCPVDAIIKRPEPVVRQMAMGTASEEET